MIRCYTIAFLVKARGGRLKKKKKQRKKKRRPMSRKGFFLVGLT